MTKADAREMNEFSGTFEDKCINTIRFLAVDAVQKANSGHPGMPMEASDLAYVLWTRVMRYNPGNPRWANRDRFVLSAGHGSMLLYAMLYLTGYGLSLDEIKAFRQWESQTPGHPEYGCAPGVETTTGPLGQGFATGVGMAIAERFMAQRFNKPEFPVVDYNVYALVSDGDIMEGISSEAASLAGHLGLGKLVYIYLDNRISIEGSTDLTISEDVGRRFEAYNWDVQHVNGYDLPGIEAAVDRARAEVSRPSLIIARTHIAYGSPNKQDTADAHGAPLGEEEIALTKRNLGWPESPAFLVPEDVLAHFREAEKRGQESESAWQTLWDKYKAAYPDLVAQWDEMYGRDPTTWESALPRFTPEDGSVATRSASGKTLQAVAPHLPGLLGGSADLAPSNNTYLKDFGEFKRSGERNFHFGVREHAMGAILNGMALSGALIPYGGTFLVFSDYMRPAIRLGALMGLHVIYVFTHDSIGLGEDGPTHQPIEHIASLRAIPNLTLIRPADAQETVESWRVALKHEGGPVALILTRQKLPVLDRNRCASASLLERGAYVLIDSNQGGTPALILLGTGSEVPLLFSAYDRLTGEGVKARVVSMPSWELFEKQPPEYREEVLPPGVKARLAVEAGSPLGWERYTGTEGRVIGIDHFGASAPADVLFEKFGFTVNHVVEVAQELLAKS